MNNAFFNRQQTIYPALVFITKDYMNKQPSLGFTTIPPTFPEVKVQYEQTVCGWKVRGNLSCVGDYILPEFNTLFDQIQKPQNCYTTPNLGGAGASDR
jgi:hypothetical protein